MTPFIIPESIEPLEFIHANEKELAPSVNLLGSVIMAENVDILIQQKAPFIYAGMEPSQAPILGDLYETGLFEYEYEGGTWHIRTFPAAPKVNQTMEELGLRPGEDVVEFKRFDGSYLSTQDYVYAVTQKQFPQSSYNLMFEHDRNGDHAPGALLLPPFALDAVQSLARNAWTDKQIERVADLFDRATEFNGEASNEWVESDGKSVQPFYNNRHAEKMLKKIVVPDVHIPVIKSMLYSSRMKDHFAHILELVAAYRARVDSTPKKPVDNN